MIFARFFKVQVSGQFYEAYRGPIDAIFLVRCRNVWWPTWAVDGLVPFFRVNIRYVNLYLCCRPLITVGHFTLEINQQVFEYVESTKKYKNSSELFLYFSPGIDFISIPAPYCQDFVATWPPRSLISSFALLTYHTHTRTATHCNSNQRL